MGVTKTIKNKVNGVKINAWCKKSPSVMKAVSALPPSLASHGYFFSRLKVVVVGKKSWVWGTSMPVGEGKGVYSAYRRRREGETKLVKELNRLLEEGVMGIMVVVVVMEDKRDRDRWW